MSQTTLSRWYLAASSRPRIRPDLCQCPPRYPGAHPPPTTLPRSVRGHADRAVRPSTTGSPLNMREQEEQPQLPDDEEYRKLFGLDIYLTPVFVISSITIVAFVTGSLVFQEAATEVFKNTREWLTINLDWFFMIAANLTLLFCLYVACSPLGKVRLGGADAKPEYSNATWFAMLFAAGVGIAAR